MEDSTRATVTMPVVTHTQAPSPSEPRPNSEGEGNAVRKDGDGRSGSTMKGLLAMSGSRAGGGRGGRRSAPKEPKGGGDGRIDLRNTWQILAGSILVPLGVVFILISWYGAAHTAYVQQQIPYLVSGSFVGLGCLVLGGLLYWAHWLYRIYDQADMHHEEQLRVFEQMIRALGERAGDGVASAPGDRPPPPAAWSPATMPLPPGAAETGATSGSASYVVTPSGSVYHLPNCPVVAHHTEGLRVIGTAGAAGMDPCRICLPAS